jgi:hypothetical protein
VTLMEKLQRAEAALLAAVRTFETRYAKMQRAAKAADRAHREVARLGRRVESIGAEIEKALCEGWTDPPPVGDGDVS